MKSREVVGTWTAVGAGVGVALGAATDSLALWLAIGVAGGAIIGFLLNLRAGSMNA